MSVASGALGTNSINNLPERLFVSEKSQQPLCFHLLSQPRKRVMTSPFVTLKPTRRKDANYCADFFKIFLRANTKCARPQIADRRIGISNSIYMICVFIFIVEMLRFEIMAFFDRKAFVGLCRYSSCSMAATSFSRRVCQRRAIVSI